VPGMSSGLQADSPTIAAAFRSALLHQGLVVVALMVILALAWNILRARQLARVRAGGALAQSSDRHQPEPAARRLLRYSFGLIWIFDGILQGQWSMPIGMPAQVVQPTVLGSPAWVQHLVNGGMTIWTDHPITAAAAAVWIQVGLGLFLLVAPRGSWSRVAGASSALWGIVVWVFGESFGGIFAPGLSWMFGAPGAVLFYCAAGLLVALPERAWSSARLGRVILSAMGVFFLGMAVLQAWPGRGFWQGRVGDRPGAGTLTAMVFQMARTRQPKVLSSVVSAFARFDSAHGFAVNLVVVVGLAAVGAGLLSGRPRLVRAAVISGAVLCLADWVLVQDFGFFGGVGTDPNSMIPMALLFVAGYLALVRVPAPADSSVPLPTVTPLFRPLSWATLWRRLDEQPGDVLRGLAALSAFVVVLLGAVPMAIASTNRQADPIVAEAIDGAPQAVDLPSPNFRLVDQLGRTVSLSALRAKAVVLTFLDPVCVSDCPLIAQELKEADSMLGGRERGVVLVAVVANPLYRATSYVRAFDRQEGLEHLTNWRYVTGTLPQLERVWNEFGVEVLASPTGAMVGHSDVVYVIGPGNRTRYVLNADPGPGTSASKSSFAAELVSELETVLPKT
jgi:cytochrome oxidase Cu insertion factor (SCO1/SenC/PrrC family)